MTDDITAKTTTVLDAFRTVRDSVDNLQRLVTSTERERIGELERDNNALRAQLADSVPRCTSTRALMNEAGEVERCPGALGHRGACFGGVPPVEPLADALERGKVVSTLREENEKLRALIAGKSVSLAVDAVEVKPAEEQGPWVILKGDGDSFAMSTNGWTKVADKAIRYDTKGWAIADSRPTFDERVITLAEAREIEASRK